MRARHCRASSARPFLIVPSTALRLSAATRSLRSSTSFNPAATNGPGRRVRWTRSGAWLRSGVYPGTTEIRSGCARSLGVASARELCPPRIEGRLHDVAHTCRRTGGVRRGPYARRHYRSCQCRGHNGNRDSHSLALRVRGGADIVSGRDEGERLFLPVAKTKLLEFPSARSHQSIRILMNFITVPLFFGCNFFPLGFVQKEPHSLAISERCELFGYFHMIAN